MRITKIIACCFFVFFVTYIHCQQTLTSIYTEQSPPRLEFLGIEGDNLYYIKVHPNGYFIMKESLSDNELESEVIHLFTPTNGPIEHFSFHNGKVLLNNSSSLLIFDIEEEKEDIVDISKYEYTGEIIYSHNKGFLPFIGTLIEINLQSLQFVSTNIIEKHILDGMLYNFTNSDDHNTFLNEGKNVLRDSVAMSFHRDVENGSFFYSVNLHTKEISILESFLPGESLHGNIWSDLNGWHYYHYNGNNGVNFFYTFTSTEDGIVTKKIPLRFDSDYTISFLSDTHIVGLYPYEDFQNLTNIDYVVVQNLVDDTYQEYTFEENRGIRYGPNGYYSVDGNTLFFVEYDGSSRPILEFDSELVFINQIGLNFISWYAHTFGEQWLVSSNITNGLRTLHFVDENSAVDLGEISTLEIFNDAAANRKFLWAGPQESEYAFHEITNDEIVTIQKFEDPIKSGGIFEIPENTFDPIIRATTKYKYYDYKDFYFYNFLNNYEEVNQEDIPQYRRKDFVQVGDYFYNFKLRDLHNFNWFVSRFHKETNVFEQQTINYINEKPKSIFKLHKGYDFMLLETYEHPKIHMATLDLDGNLRHLKDENNSDAYSGIKSKNNIISTNGHVYALAKDPNGESLVPYKMGKDFANTKVLFDNPDFSDGEEILLLAEGDIFSYINAGAYFFIKNDGKTIYFNENDSTIPYYFNDKFYFNDKYFDENSETFVEWNAGIDNIQHIQNDIVYSTINDEIAFVDINTYETESLSKGDSEAIFYSGKTQTIIYLPEIREVCWSDGTSAGTKCNEIPENIKTGSNYRVEKDFFIFTGSNEDIGSELFFMDSSGEILTFDINQGIESSAPFDFVSNDDYLYFTAYRIGSGRQLYSINLNSATSTSNVSLVEKIDVYPNPSSSMVSINSDLFIRRIEVFNSLGNEVTTIQINNKDELQNIDISFLSSGIYYFKYISKDQIVGVSTLKKL